MPNTGHTWGSFSFVQLAAADWDAIAQADDAAADVSDAITITTKSAIIIGWTVTAGVGVVVDDSVTIAILGTSDDTNYEDAPGLAGVQVGNPFKFQITPVESDSVHGQFSIDPRDYNKFKIAMLNESGQSLNVSFRQKDADIPVAS